MINKKELIVLSLFDGISCGRVALERAGFKVKKYYASEIDKYAIQIAQKNYPNTIQLGDITKWKDWDIDWKSIDLILAGSPCQGFSFAGKQLNFEDPRSKLFFEFVDILNHIKKENPNVYFLLENVKMKKEYQNIISNKLGIEPILINSALVSAQNRKRLYWTNIPFVTQPQDKGILLKDILETYHIPLSKKTINYCLNAKFRQDRPIKLQDKSITILTTINSRTFLNTNNEFIKLTPIECERLQTLDDGYTEGISNSQRYKCLGNGWTVDVIKHILEHIK